MRKILVILALLACCAGLDAQSSKKTRNTARNTQEAVSERKISNRFNKGLRDFYTAQYEDAMQDFSNILSDVPKHAPSYYMIAKIHTARQAYSEAQNNLKQAVKLDKDNIWYQVALAENYLATQDYKLATPMWEKICATMPDNEGYLTNLCECYRQMGKTDKMEETLARIGRLAVKQEELPELEENQPRSNAGIVSLNDQQYDVAVDQLLEALKHDDSDIALWEALVTAVEKSGRWSVLTSLEEDLTTMFPQSPDMLSALANAFLYLQQTDQAVVYYKQALSFAFDQSQIQRIRAALADAYTRMGDTENAARYR